MANNYRQNTRITQMLSSQIDLHHKMKLTCQQETPQHGNPRVLLIAVAWDLTKHKFHRKDER